MSGSVIVPYRSLRGNGGQPRTLRLLEKAAMTFLQGTPVVVEAASGYLIDSPTINSALTIAGFAQEKGANLTSSGVAQVANAGAPINQSAAKIIYGGAWPNDGRCGVWIADDSVTFKGNLKDDQTYAATDKGVIYGLTKDGTTNLWYIDKTVTLAANGAIVEIIDSIELQFGETPTAGGEVEFRITRAGQQFVR